MASVFGTRAALALLAVVLAGSSPEASGPAPLRIFLRGGEKTHGEGEHDHPRFVAEWTPLLASRGAVVESALAFPTREQLERTDVLVMYAAEGGSIHGEERANLDAYLARGGGIVVLHDAICGDDPQWFKTVVGGAWEHGHAKWHEGKIGLYFKDREHPISRGAENFDFDDEIYTELHLEPSIHVLATAFPNVFEAPPQMWTYEKDAYRAFVSIQGHEFVSFAHPAWRTLLLRGIAWAGRRDVDLLTTADERASLAYPPGGPTRPEEAAAKIKIAPEFELSLVAAEPLIEKPISIDWDAQGRMWVACTPGYPEKAQFSGVPAHDRIDVLEDTNGDGRMDRAQTFCDGLDLVTSFVMHERGVIASAAPDILLLQDTDGDGRADVREPLYTGFGFGDTHAVVSNLRWGLDGWIYATQGYSGNDSKDICHGNRHFGKIGNGLFRFRPDGSAIEMVSSYGSNTWGCDFTDDGELFFTMANGAHARHVVVPETALARGRMPKVETWKDIADHERVFPIYSDGREPYVQIDFVGGFTAAAGCLIYEGGAWPKTFSGNHFVAEPTVHLVHRDVLAPSGVSFTASKPEETEFIASTDPWFLPVHMRVGPDGAMYVLDMYNQAAVHNDTRGPPHGPTNAAVRPDRDHSHGRIWRVQHREARALPTVKLAKASSTELVLALEHENMWVRMTAERLMLEQGVGSALPQLAKLAHESPRAYARIHALWTLARLDVLDHGLLDEALVYDPAAGVRKNAARIFGLGPSDDPSAKFWEPMRRALVDPDPRVQIEALATIARAEDPGQTLDADLIAAFARAQEDWTRSLVLSIAAAAPDRLLASAIASPERAKTASLVVELAGVLGRAGDPEDCASAIEALGDPSASEEVAASALRRLDREQKPGSAPAFGPRTQDALKSLLSRENLELAAAALPFAVRWDATHSLSNAVDALAERLSKRALDPAAPSEARLSSVRALLAIPARRESAIAAAETLLDPLQAPEIQLAVLDELGRIDDERTTTALVGAYPALGTAGRERAFERILERPARVRAFIGAIKAKKIAPNDLGPHKIAQLRNYSDADVAKRANAVLDAVVGTASSDVEALIAKLLPVVEQPGNADHGRELFTQNCATCHTLNGAGGNVGPKLDGVGAHGARALLPIVLDPNRTVEGAYVEYAAETTDERRFGGVLARETPESIVLRSTAGDVELQRSELASLRSTGRSPMPVGFESLGAEGLRDLLAYLSAGYEGFRTLDLRPHFDASTQAGMYDTRRDANPMRFMRTGVIDVEGVPFDVLDPALAPSGKNALVLKGGRRDDWQSKTSCPQRVEVPIGFALARVHVLGGIAAWGFPCSRDSRPILRWVWRYADGSEEEVVLHDGVEFADWIGRNDVPGSQWVPDLVHEDSAGQVRTFSLAPSRVEKIASIALESYDNDMAPTFLALTAELEGAPKREVRSQTMKTDLLLVGGGSSHDFARWFGGSDLELLRASSGIACDYTETPAAIEPALASLKVLALTNNQPLPASAHKSIEDFVARGGGLLCVHPACWYNWLDWPAYNAQLLGGGSKSHEDYAEFEVRIVDSEHPLAQGVPPVFRVKDELYRFQRDPEGAEIHVIAIGRSLARGRETAEYPVVWTVAREKGRTACITLGHDGAAHELPAYRALLTNAARWAAGR